MQALPGRLHVDVTCLWGRTSPAVGITRVVAELANAVRSLSEDNQAWRYDFQLHCLRPVAWEELDPQPLKAGRQAEKAPAPAFRAAIRRLPGIRLAGRLIRAMQRRFSKLLIRQPMPCFAADDCFVFADIIHDKDQLATYRAALAQSEGSAVFYCHDLIPVKFRQFVGDQTTLYFEELLEIFSTPRTHTLCNSLATLRDLEAWRQAAGRSCSPAVVVSPGGDISVADRDTCVADGIDDNERIIAVPYLLFVSTIEIRKNHRVLIDAYALLIEQGRTDLPLLVFAGQRGWMVDDLLAEIDAGEGACRHVRIIERLSDAQLCQLYRGALLTLYPSFYEGWGIPVAESSTIGKVCICSDRGSLPEVAQGLLPLIDPSSPRAWADAIAGYLDQPDRIAQDEEAVRQNYRPRSWATFRQDVRELLANV